MSIDVESELRAAMRDSARTISASEPFIDRVLHEAGDAPIWACRRRTRRGRRRLAAVALGVLVCAIPANLAVAYGPVSYRDAYGWMFAEPVDGGPVDGPINPATLRRVASGTGPDGMVFSVVTGTNTAGRTCLTPVFETAESGLQPLPTDVVVQGGGECRAVPSALPFGRGDSLDLAVQGVAGLYTCAAGEAVRAEVRADATGLTYPALLAYGRFFAWMPPVGDGIGGMEDAYTITGYAADGRIVGQGHLFDFTRFDSPGGQVIGPVEDENGRIITDGTTLQAPGD